MRTIALTGGIGTGKSTLAEVLVRADVPLVDTDELAHALVEPGQPASAEIRTAFGSGVFEADGRLCRAVLAARVFGDEGARRVLEGILHPRIHAAWQGQVAAWREAGRPLAVVVIPLLFEKQLESRFDLSICVACLAATQQARLRARGWNDVEIERRLAAQWPLAEKIKRADRVIWNEGTVELLEEQAKRILRSEGWPIG